MFNELNKIIQSSAAVECINSILRTYLNASKNQINQPFLNLFMAYHNHRRFKAGERKGKTPFEILSGQKQDFDWLEHVLPRRHKALKSQSENPATRLTLNPSV